MPNYSFLKTDLINTSENDSTEFADQIPKFVEKAEDRLIKEIDDPGLDNFASFTFTASSPTVSLPVDSLVVRNVSFTTSTSSLITPLLQRTYEYAIDYWPYASASVGTPRYYSRKIIHLFTLYQLLHQLCQEKYNILVDLFHFPLQQVQVQQHPTTLVNLHIMLYSMPV